VTGQRPVPGADGRAQPGPGLAALVHRPAGEPAAAWRGLASLELGAAIGPGTSFNTGSVGKQVTAHLVVLAARAGLLGLDQTVSHYLPRFRVPGVTVADLMRHHGGVRDAESLLSLAGLRDLDHYTVADLLELAYRQTRRAVPSGRFLYSNTGYLLLAQVLRTVHGTGISELAKEALFGPLDMASACFKDDPGQVVPGAAASYRAVPGGWRHCGRPVALAGAGSLWCTMADLDRWLGYLHAQWLENPGELPFAGDIGYLPSDHQPLRYGAGLYADPRAGREAAFHYGHEQGFSAAAWLSAVGLRVICLSNHAGVAADQVAARIRATIRRDAGYDPSRILARELAAALAPTPGSTPDPSATPSAGLWPIPGPTPATDTGPGPGATPDPAPAPASGPAPGKRPAPGAGQNDAYGEDTARHTMLGSYACDQVPGRLRLSRCDGTLFLWRRGTRDQLSRTGPATYSAPGCTITLAQDGDAPGEPVTGFRVDLDRAPGLEYRIFD
jgi:CubicO group peptidase (beta-lactamase class C family)